MILPDDVVENVARALEEEFFGECAFKSRVLARAALEAARYGEMRDCLTDARLFVELVRVHWQNWHPDEHQQIAEATDCVAAIDRALLSSIGTQA